MRNPDELQDVQCRNDLLINGIAAAFKDRPVEEFRSAAIACLLALDYETSPTHLKNKEFQRCVWEPIEKFTKEPVEQRYLLMKACEMLLGAVYASVHKAYHTKILFKEPPPERVASEDQSSGTSPEARFDGNFPAI